MDYTAEFYFLDRDDPDRERLIDENRWGTTVSSKAEDIIDALINYDWSDGDPGEPQVMVVITDGEEGIPWWVIVEEFNEDTGKLLVKFYDDFPYLLDEPKDGTTPIIFEDGQVKELEVRQVWRTNI